MSRNYETRVWEHLLTTLCRNWSRSELERLIPEIEADQAKHRAGEAKFVSSVFAEFYTQSEAQAAYQMLGEFFTLS